MQSQLLDMIMIMSIGFVRIVGVKIGGKTVFSGLDMENVELLPHLTLIIFQESMEVSVRIIYLSP